MATGCQETTAKGAPCKGTPVSAEKGDPRYCMAHQPEETKASLGFGGAQPGAGRPRLPRPHEAMRALVEQNVTALLRPYFATLGLELHDDGAVTESGRKPIKYVWAGTDEPAHEMEDLGAQIAAAERLLDRVYGMPRQQLEHTGAEGGPIEHAAVDPGDPETRRLAHELLKRRARPQE